MENSMRDNIFFILDDIINNIKASSEFEKCILLREKIENNKELLQLIETLKEKQKKDVRGNFQDDDVKKELDALLKKIESFPIYVEYSNNLSIVNEKISLLKDELNCYFVEKFNLLK